MAIYFKVGNPNVGILRDGTRLEKTRGKWQEADGKTPARDVKKAILDGVIFKLSEVVVMGCAGEALRSHLGQLQLAQQCFEAAKVKKSKEGPAQSLPCFQMVVKILDCISYEDKAEGYVRDKYIELWNAAHVFCTHDLALMIEEYSRSGNDYTDLTRSLKQHCESLWNSKYFKTPKNEDTQRKVRKRLIWAALKLGDHDVQFLTEAKSDLDGWLKQGKNRERTNDEGESVDDYASCVTLVDDQWQWLRKSLYRLPKPTAIGRVRTY
jgi:hypothetical protein